MTQHLRVIAVYSPTEAAKVRGETGTTRVRMKKNPHSNLQCPVSPAETGVFLLSSALFRFDHIKN